MKNPLIQHVSWTMAIVGLHEDQDTADARNNRRIIFLYVIMVSVVASMFMVSVTNYDNFDTFVFPAIHLAAGSVLLGTVHITIVYRKSIQKMLQVFDLDLYSYPDEDLIQIRNTNWYLDENNVLILLKLFKYVEVIFYFMVVSPACVELAYYGRIYTFPYPCWVPWKLDSAQRELFILLIQCIQGICGLAFHYCINVFIAAAIVKFFNQYEKLNLAIRSLRVRTLTSLDSDQCHLEYNEAMRQNIIHCIRHHQNLHKCFQYFKIWFTAVFSTELAICLMTFTLALYVAMNASSLLQFWNFFSVFFFIWASFCMKCLIGEIFAYLNDRLAETIFWEMHWLEVNKSNQRLFVIFHQIANRPVMLYGLSVFEASCATLGRMIRTTYSTYNVLKSRK